MPSKRNMIRQFARGNRPKPFKVALKRMQAVAGQVKFLPRRRGIEDGQYFLNCVREIRPYSPPVVALVEAFEAAMFETPDH